MGTWQPKGAHVTAKCRALQPVCSRCDNLDGCPWLALDMLEVQAVRGVVEGWVSIPAVEWDAVMLRLNRAA